MSKYFFGLLSFFIIGSIIVGIALEEYLLFGLPLLFLGIFLAIVDFRKLFYLFLASIPLSTEILLPGGIGTDLPAEPLMIGLMLIYIVYFLKNGIRIDSYFFKHPITLLLLLHLFWICFTTLHAAETMISVKFLFAKIWYILTCYFMAGLLLKEEKDIRQFIKWVFIPLVVTVSIVFIRHALVDFSFASINKVLNPFYRNHVSYAAILVVFFPYLWYAAAWQSKYTTRWYLSIIVIVFILTAIYLSYTRAAYISLFLAVITYFFIRFKLIKLVMGSTVIGLVVGLGFLVSNNKFLDFAPNYTKAIAHKKFDNLINATANGEDVSTMERVYRWVAGVSMVSEKPWVGFGPGNFYTHYKAYTVKSFTTYVSGNPEKSGIHCYYLMVAVEQGIIGAIIFLSLCFTTLLKGEQLYHSTTSKSNRRLVLMVTLSLTIIYTLLIVNDMVETDKVGTFFFMGMAMLVNLDRIIEKEKI